MPMRGIAVGRADDATHPDSVRAAFAEFFSTFIFVLAGEGVVLSLAKLTGGMPTDTAGLIAVALAHALALAVAVAAAMNISGGHVNPAVTMGALVGGHVSLMRAFMYWIAQLLGAVLACVVLKVATNGMSTTGFTVARGIGAWQALVLEVALTFALVYTVYATGIDPKRGVLATIAPLAIGFIVGANILAGGAFDGASMNPARAFGPALLSGTWRNHWVYWVGPLLGGAIAGVIYELVMTPSSDTPHQPLQPEDY